jgi:hypothetical protein
MAHWFNGNIEQSFRTHFYNFLGPDVFKIAGDAYEPLVRGGAILLVYWLILFWMYRRRVFCADLTAVCFGRPARSIDREGVRQAHGLISPSRKNRGTKKPGGGIHVGD